LSDQASEYLYILLRRTLREIERLEGLGLSRARARLRPTHVAVLAALLEASPLTPGELAARCEIEPSTMTGLLRALATEGLIEREKVVLDQRTEAVSLTPRGRAASRVAVRTRTVAQQAVLRGLPRDLAGQLQTILGRLAVAAQGAADASAQKQRAKPAAGRR
jgi:DNA-binding MarR family transcriptional regulator